jgi:hypothetical protein
MVVSQPSGKDLVVERTCNLCESDLPRLFLKLGKGKRDKVEGTRLLKHELVNIKARDQRRSFAKANDDTISVSLLQSSLEFF